MACFHKRLLHFNRRKEESQETIKLKPVKDSRLFKIIENILQNSITKKFKNNKSNRFIYASRLALIEIDLL